MTRPRLLLAALVVTCALGGCGGGAETERSAPSPRASSTPSASATTYVGGALTECFIPKTEATVRPVRLTGTGLRLPGIVFRPAAPEGRTVLVLLHQTDGNGRCGWGYFGNAVAATGMTALAFDQCGYGEAECSVSDPDDPLPQVRLALTYARDRLHADRVVLVGASMGGSRTVRAVAAGAAVDAWADVSGPSEFDRVALAPLATKIHVPGLVALAADTDGEEEATLAEALARDSGATWIAAEGGHGYELLTDSDGALRPVGERVLALAAG